MKSFLLYYLGILNLWTLALYGADKGKARREDWRVPETVLLGLPAFGGGLGALVGMAVFHHKTRKWQFKLLVPFFTLLWGVFLYFFLWKGFPF